jgi:ubiquinone/menaquinone biosynthesis C-methylase UbiE
MPTHDTNSNDANTHDTDEWLELLDLDAEALRTYWAAAVDWLQSRVADARRIVDLGCGTGTASVTFAHSFPTAEVLAVDADRALLARAAAKAAEAGVSDRIRTVLLDVDAGWPDVEPVDLLWASMSLHHFADPDQVLRQAFGAVRPGGWIAVAEFDEPLRFLPDDLGVGRPGLERRCMDVMHSVHAQQLPHLGADWSQRLSAAGFSEVEHRVFAIDLRAPQQQAAIRYTQLWLTRLAAGVGAQLDHDDRAVLTALVSDGPDAVVHRDDLHVRGARTVTLGRRP